MSHVGALRLIDFHGRSIASDAARALACLAALLSTTRALGQDCGWFRVPGAWDPLERYDHAMAFDAARERVVMFGGNSGGTIHDDVWEWDGARWRQRAERGPSSRTGPAMVYDSARGACVLFGGWDGDEAFFGDTWEWDGAAWTHLSNAGPSPRAWCAVAFDSARSRVVLHGGYGLDTHFGDTWEWDGREWTHVSDSGPSPRAVHAMAFDAIRNVCVLVGGVGPSNSYPGETWEWDGQSWTLKDNTMNRAGMALAFDERRERVLLFGGSRSLNRFGDTWLWDGENWALEQTDGPEPRTSPGMVYDHARSEIVLYGGWMSIHREPFFDTWLYECGTRPRLAVSSSCPEAGPVHVTWRNATPNGTIALVHGREFDRFVVPPTRACPGTILGLSGGIRTVVRRTSDGKGGGSIMGTAAPPDCGTHLQLVDLSTCYTSNVVEIE